MEGYNEHLPWNSVGLRANTAIPAHMLSLCIHRGTFGDKKTLFHLEPLNPEDISVSCVHKFYY